MTAYDYTRGTLHNADALDVAASLEPGTVRLVYCDGPYGLGKGEWDKAQGPALVDWYAPHFDAWDRVCMESASLAVWGITRSWAHLHVELERRGWTQAGQIVWDKGLGWILGSDPDALRSWPQTHEIVGLYRRDALDAPTCAGVSIQYAAGADDRNWIREWLGAQWQAAGLTRRQADEALGTNGMAGHYFGRSQWALPTWEAYQTLAAYAAEHGRPHREGLPWLVHPDAVGLRGTFEHLRGTFEHLRAEFEHLRAPFTLGTIAPSVLRQAPPTLGTQRHGHPCEKPAGLTRRLVEVLTRPGELVFEPFGGSSPVARVCEALPEPDARPWVSCELDPKHVARTRSMLANTQGDLL